MITAGTRTRVRVVTDSTAALPDGVAEKLGIVVVPLQVHLDGRAGWEGTEIRPADVSRTLRARGRVATLPPTPQAFTQAYTTASLIGQDVDGFDIVSVHMSGELSETANHARTGSRPLDYAGVAVEVVDARTTAMGLGFAVMAAAAAAAEGHGAKLVARAAEDAARRTDALFYVDTLEYLRRGGRIGPAASLVGTALSIKPLLHVQDGLVAPLEKVRGSGRGLARLEDRVVERCGPSGMVRVAVQHLDAPSRAADLAVALQHRLIGRVTSLTVSEVGAAVGAHVGPGLVGAVVLRAA